MSFCLEESVSSASIESIHENNHIQEVIDNIIDDFSINEVHENNNDSESNFTCSNKCLPNEIMNKVKDRMIIDAETKEIENKSRKISVFYKKRIDESMIRFEKSAWYISDIAETMYKYAEKVAKAELKLQDRVNFNKTASKFLCQQIHVIGQFTRTIEQITTKNSDKDIDDDTIQEKKKEILNKVKSTIESIKNEILAMKQKEEDEIMQKRSILSETVKELCQRQVEKMNLQTKLALVKAENILIQSLIDNENDSISDYTNINNNHVKTMQEMKKELSQVQEQIDSLKEKNKTIEDYSALEKDIFMNLSKEEIIRIRIQMETEKLQQEKE